MFDDEKEEETNGSELTFESVRDQIEDDEQESEEEKEKKFSRVQLKINGKSMPCNTSNHSTKIQRLKGILRPKTWPNPFVQGRYEKIERFVGS